VLGNVYSAAVRMAMTPYSYPLNEAGVNLAVASERRGITLSAGGYSQKIPDLAEFAIPFLTKPQIDEAQFGIIKQGMLRGLANFSKQPPTSQAFEVFRELIRETHFTPSQQAEALAALTYDDLVEYFGRVFDAIRVRAFFYGNMTEASAQQTVELLVAGVKPTRAIPDAERYRGRVIKLAKGSSTILRRPIEANDSITMMLYEGDSADVRGRAALVLLRKAFPPGFYGDLRTLQQTGYIVQSSTFEAESLPMLFALSQSSVVSTDSLRGRFISNIAHFVEDLGELTNETFEANREAAIADLSKKSTSFDEELARNAALAYQHHGDFADTDKQIAALREFSKDEWTTWVREFLLGARRVSIQLDGATDRQRFQESDLETLRKNAEGWQERPVPETK
jgi:insulysin